MWILVTLLVAIYQFIQSSKDRWKDQLWQQTGTISTVNIYHFGTVMTGNQFCISLEMNEISSECLQMAVVKTWRGAVVFKTLTDRNYHMLRLTTKLNDTVVIRDVHVRLFYSRQWQQQIEKLKYDSNSTTALQIRSNTIWSILK